MIDPKAIRDRHGEVRRMLKARGSAFDLDALLEANTRRLELIPQVQDTRAERNRTGAAIAAAKKAGGDASGPMAEMEGINSRLAGIETELAGVEEACKRMAMALPNMIDESVPVGPDASSNVEVRSWGERPAIESPSNHVEIMSARGLADLPRAAKIAGARFYILRGAMVRLNQAIIRLAMDRAGEAGYMAVQPPYMINRASMEGAVIAEDFEDVIYGVEGEDLYLVGTSEHAMAAMHSGEIMEGLKEPVRYAGCSPCFRKEAGAHGADQKGIFRVRQFEKVEMFAFTRPGDSGAEHERMLGVAESFYRELGIPHRTMLLSSGDMGKVSAKTYDIEAWMAGQGAYREVVSCSNCLDYQARRLGIRYRPSTDAPTEYLHTLNSTLAATTRVMVAILEDMQEKDGSVAIPRALQGYMGGATHI
ncbi:MAG: serine--tRNA ligase [Nitrosopumilus sp.]|nr:serine--tRNA ligase [Nitrosopumilus sp.]MDA7958754.1 serine--tRNA ligase [Nitrosopumilus sp.]